MVSHTNVKDHQDDCCVIHGCRYGDQDCPVFVGAAPRNKKHPCVICEGTYKNSQLAYELIDEYHKYVFSDLQKLRTFMTKLIQNGYGTGYRRIDKKHGKVIEYKLVPVREITMQRFMEEHEIRKRFK